MRDRGLRWRVLWLLLPAAALTGCPVTPGEAPQPYQLRHEPVSGGEYYIYVPTDYTPDRSWPLVVALHGTNPYDTASRQIKSWDLLAEQKGFIIVAPILKSPQGILPKIRSWWYEDLEEDETEILRIIEHVSGDYRVDPDAVLLAGFSAGGYPLYWTGLRNPDRFSMLIAQACNTDVEMMGRISLTDRARKLPIRIFWGRDDPVLRSQSWQAVRFLRNNECYNTEWEQIEGGHFRPSPERAWSLWLEVLPKRHH